MKTYIAAFAIILFISGCSSFSGEDKFSRSYVSAHIIANKTTEAEVKALYGTPDDQSSSSDGSYVWYYDRDGKMDFLSNAVSLIPGASALSGAVTQATIAQHTKDDINSVSDKVSGNTEHRSGRLTIYFTNNKVVSSWYM